MGQHPALHSPIILPTATDIAGIMYLLGIAMLLSGMLVTGLPLTHSVKSVFTLLLIIEMLIFALQSASLYR